MTRNNFIISLIIVFLSGLIYALFTKPVINEVLAKREYIISLDVINEQSKQIQDKVDSLRSEFNSANETRVEVIKNSIPRYTSSDVSNFFVSLNDLLLASSLPSDTDYSIGNGVLEGELVRIEVAFVFNDVNYNAIRNFILNLQNWERGIRIEQISFYSSSSGEESNYRTNILNADIKISGLFASVNNTTNIEL